MGTKHRRPRDAQEEEILLQWGVRLAEEIESLSSQVSSAIKHGHLQDALEEASIVLELTGQRDLARRASDLAEQVALMRRYRGSRMTIASLDQVKRTAKTLASEIKKRMEERMASIGAHA